MNNNLVYESHIKMSNIEGMGSVLPRPTPIF